VPLEDVKRNTEYENTADLQASGVLSTTTSDQETEDAEEVGHRAGMVKLWKLWDLRTKTRIVHADGHKKLLQSRTFTYCPLAVLKFYERRNAFLPLPPIYNWMSPQDEINETREMQKIHRRRALRRYMKDPSVLPTEVEKLESAEDMVVIDVAKTVPAPIVPIQDAPLDAQNWTELAATRDDLNQITGVSGEARNSPQAPTATQANIMNVRATIRESRARQQVADWLAEIARLMLMTIRERVKMPFMIKRMVDPFAFQANPVKTLETAQLWQEIQSEDIGDLDVDITIDVASLSPVAEDAQRNQWNVVLSLLTNPALASILFTPNPQAPEDPSPLLRKTLVLNGVTSDQEIREIWRVGQALLQQAAAAAQAQASLAKQPEPPKVSIAFKGEDFLSPIIGPIALALLQAGHELGPMQAAEMSAPESPLAAGNGNGSGGLTIPAPGGSPTGTPTRGPGM